MYDDRRPRDSLVQRCADACQRFRAALQAGEAPQLEEYLREAEPSARDALLRELLLLEMDERARQGGAPDFDEYRRRFPRQTDVVDSVWNAWRARQAGEGATRSAGSTAGGELTETWKPDAAEAGAGPPPEIPGFEVLHPLGQGGMGVVLKARHVQLGRLVAIKMPLLEKLEPRARQRFLREARAAAGLNHPHICPIYEVGEAAGRPYIEMAYIDGVSLKEWAAAGPVSPHQAAEVVAALSRAVAYAHEQGVIHRDIKPSNVMVESRTGNPVLMDFGLAKDLAGGDAELTQAGQVLGTPAYMAPEQATGAADEVGPAADVYALGGVLYALLTGRAPFQGSVADVLRQVQTSEPKSPRSVRPGLHRDLDTICLKAMAKEPQERFASAQALAEDLERFCAGEVILARRAGPATKAAKWARRHPVAAAGTLAVCLVISIAVVLVQRALAERRITTQVSRFAALLEEFDGSQKGHDQLARNLDELRQLDPQQAEFARRSFIKHYEDVVQQLLQGSLDDPDEIAHIEGVIARLERLAPDRGKSMRQALDQRQRTFSDVFELAPPFDGLQAVFRKGQVVPGETAMQLASPQADVPVARMNTTQRSRGNVELLATFSAGRPQDGRQLGLSLNAGSEHAYEFLVTIPPTGQGARASMSIEKNGVPLAEQELARPGDSPQLVVRREGSRLTFRVNETARLEFDDVFALTSKAGGFFGIVWPREAGVERLVARRQNLPVVSSPLEDADLLFQSGDFDTALRGYETQRRSVAADDLRQEARCKMGLCLLQLEQYEAAAELLESIAEEGHPRWSPVAACHLWSFRLEQQDYEAADRIFAYLDSRYEFQDLAVLLPRNLLRNVVLAYTDRHRGPNLFGFDQGDLLRLERGIAVGELLTGKTNVKGKIGLLRGNRALGLRRRALRIAFELLHNKAWLRELPYESQLQLVEEYCWMMRGEGDTRGALSMLNQWIDETRRPPSAFTPLRIERARCYIALAQWEDAERDMQEYFAQVAPGEVIYRLHSAACLVEGFLRLRREDEQGAVDVWEKGLYEPWSKARRDAGHAAPPLLAEHYDMFSGMEFHQYVTLACLTGRMTEDDIRSATKWAMFRQKNSPLSVLVGTAARAKAKELTATFNNMCSTKYGRAKARELAFQQLDFPQFIRQPMYLFCLELARRGAFGGEMSPDEHDLVWDAAVDGCRLVESGGILQGQLVQLFMAWELQTGFVGWGGVEKTLQPSVRGPLAYVLGHRFQRQGNPDQARKLFRTARQDAVATSTQRLRALAEAALANLPAPPPER